MQPIPLIFTTCDCYGVQSVLQKLLRPTFLKMFSLTLLQVTANTDQYHILTWKRIGINKMELQLTLQEETSIFQSNSLQRDQLLDLATLNAFSITLLLLPHFSLHGFLQRRACTNKPRDIGD